MSSWHPTTNSETTNPEFSCNLLFIKLAFFIKINRYFIIFCLFWFSNFVKNSRFVDLGLVVGWHDIKRSAQTDACFHLPFACLLTEWIWGWFISSWDQYKLRKKQTRKKYIPDLKVSYPCNNEVCTYVKWYFQNRNLK